ncbi:PaaI family thioesterase [Neptuniibacter sp.]|uniref:PaaI family thioesterase n=1 Tax=Neptuniibacter sp. TaxID=1962643 RepID=UPI00262F8149|nr:PaaI family thioesterase [Neptuniibacter sp.]MCP4595584.1 PaaI family thioesterase [Neptuniibacter sp.]
MLSIEELNAFFDREFPHAQLIVDEVGEKTATIRKVIGPSDLRPGGTVSGPTMMSMADAALYAAVLNEIGLVALAVTTSLNFNFLSKPSSDRDLIAKCSLIKVGQTLVVGEVSLYSDGKEEPVAHAVGTYAIPPVRP